MSMHSFWAGGVTLKIDVRPEVTHEGKFILEFMPSLTDSKGLLVVGSSQWITLRDMTENNLLDLRNAIDLALEAKVG